MKYTLQQKEHLKLIGFSMTIPSSQGFEKCPQFWSEIGQKYFSKLQDGSPISQTIIENNIGEFGLCITRDDQLYYMIAGKYQGGEVIEGLEIKELRYHEYLCFESDGSIPEGLQELISQVYHDFLPGHQEYHIDYEVMLEWYRMESPDAPLKAGLWLPVKD